MYLLSRITIHQVFSVPLCVLFQVMLCTLLFVLLYFLLSVLFCSLLCASIPLCLLLCALFCAMFCAMLCAMLCARLCARLCALLCATLCALLCFVLFSEHCAFLWALFLPMSLICSPDSTVRYPDLRPMLRRLQGPLPCPMFRVPCHVGVAPTNFLSTVRCSACTVGRNLLKNCIKSSPTVVDVPMQSQSSTNVEI
jgi:hypothetical protein